MAAPSANMHEECGECVPCCDPTLMLKIIKNLSTSLTVYGSLNYEDPCVFVLLFVHIPVVSIMQNMAATANLTWETNLYRQTPIIPKQLSHEHIYINRQ